MLLSTKISSLVPNVTPQYQNSKSGIPSLYLVLRLSFFERKVGRFQNHRCLLIKVRRGFIHTMSSAAVAAPTKRGKQREWDMIARLPRSTAMDFLLKLRERHLSKGNSDMKGKKAETHNLHCLENGCEYMERVKIQHRTEEENENDTVATHEKSGIHNHVIGETTKNTRGMKEETKDLIRSLKNVNPTGGGKGMMMLLDHANSNSNMPSNRLPDNIKQVRIGWFYVLRLSL